MRCDMPDSQFLEFVDLDHPTMSRAKELAGKGRVKQAAREAARAMFAQPLRHPLREEEIPALAAIINRRWPEQVAWLRRLADNYLLKQPSERGLLCGSNPEEEQALYRTPARVWLRRGDAVQGLARLYSLTGEAKYLDGAIQQMRRSFAAVLPLPDDDKAGAFQWHPYAAKVGHDLGHLPEKICHGLPHLRAALKPEDALVLLKGLVAEVEFNFRTCRYDVTHNITLHMLLPGLLVGLLFPALKPSGEWAGWVQKRIEEDFTSASFVTPDGYFGEGFSYQSVNQNLMLIALRYLKASGRKVSPKLRRVCERSFEFASTIVRADGQCPEFGDSHVQLIHEHYIAHHEVLHLAAAWFRREDFKAAAGSPYCEEPLEHNIWPMGLDGLAWYDSVPALPREGRVALPRDLRTSGFQFFGMGEGVDAHVGMLSCAAAHNHAHHDFASIEIYGLGRPLLTDGGMTSYGEESYRDERAHNTIVPVRRKPMGPRLDRPDHQKTLYVIHRPEVQATCMEHDLYEAHRIRRAVCLVNASYVLRSKSPDVPAFWLVVDRVERAFAYPGRNEPYDFLEAFFHFNAPQTALGHDEAALTCWSRHNPQGQVIRRYPPTDAPFEHKPQKIALADYLRAHEAVTSDANLQITAIPTNGPHSIMDMRLFQSSTGEYTGRVKRPGMAYRWQGRLPYTAAYVLVPFRGVRDQAYARVTGTWTDSGHLDVRVEFPEGTATLRAQRLMSRKPKLTIGRKAGK